ncbi:g8881 [Coccomyxa elongata]
MQVWPTSLGSWYQTGHKCGRLVFSEREDASDQEENCLQEKEQSDADEEDHQCPQEKEFYARVKTQKTGQAKGSAGESALRRRSPPRRGAAPARGLSRHRERMMMLMRLQQQKRWQNCMTMTVTHPRPQQKRMQWIKAHFNRLWRNEGQCRQEFGVLKMGSYADPYVSY